eukprot:m.49901 g.49901  ORF g.49901 m.49901 type:complete len:83 (+) comp13375_c0_seq2:251-499(+)
MAERSSYQGWLYKRGANNKAFRRRWCTLINSTLFYAKSPEDKARGTVDLQHSQVLLLADDAQSKPNSFGMQSGLLKTHDSSC